MRFSDTPNTPEIKSQVFKGVIKKICRLSNQQRLDWFCSSPQTLSLFHPPHSDTNTQRTAECFGPGMCGESVHNPPNITRLTVSGLRHQTDHSVWVLKQRSDRTSFTRASAAGSFCLSVRFSETDVKEALNSSLHQTDSLTSLLLLNLKVL